MKLMRYEIGLLVLSFAALVLLSVSARADQDSIFEIGASAGYNRGGISYDGTLPSPEKVEATPNGFFYGGHASTNLFLLGAEADFVALPVDGKRVYELTGSGQALFIVRLQEFLLRRNSDSKNPSKLGDAMFVMAGVGGGGNIYKQMVKLSLGLGGLYGEWDHPGEAEKRKAYGVYVGGAVHVRVWKLQDELRVAYYRIPKGDPGDLDAFGKKLDDEGRGWKAFRSNTEGKYYGSNRLYMELLTVPFASLGPEVYAALRQLPDGTEWLATVGVGGRIGY